MTTGPEGQNLCCLVKVFSRKGVFDKIVGERESMSLNKVVDLASKDQSSALEIVPKRDLSK